MSVKPEAVVRNIAEVMWETPPEHAIYNTGLADLVFFVVTTPPTDG